MIGTSFQHADCLCVFLQIMVTSVLLTVFYKRHPHAWNWVAVGMLSDFALRFYAGAGISPLGSVAMLLTAMADLFFPMLNIKSVPRFVPGKGFLSSDPSHPSTCFVIVQWSGGTNIAYQPYTLTFCLFLGRYELTKAFLEKSFVVMISAIGTCRSQH